MAHEEVLSFLVRYCIREKNWWCQTIFSLSNKITTA